MRLAMSCVVVGAMITVASAMAQAPGPGFVGPMPATAAAGPAPGVAERQAAALAARAAVEAGTIVLADEFTDWKVICRNAALTDCLVRSTLLAADGPRIVSLVANVSYAQGAPLVQVGADRTVPDFATLQIDTLPPIESTTCAANVCEFTGPVAALILEELKSGATLAIKYVATAGVFEGRLPLATFATKVAELQ